MSLRYRPDVSVLAGVAPFDRYPRRALEPLAPHADRLRVRDGTVVAREGELVRELLVVVAGTLLAARAGHPVAAYGPGSLIGGVELLYGRHHAVTLVAGAGLEVIVLAGPAFRFAVQTLPGLPTGNS